MKSSSDAPGLCVWRQKAVCFFVCVHVIPDNRRCVGVFILGEVKHSTLRLVGVFSIEKFGIKLG